MEKRYHLENLWNGGALKDFDPPRELFKNYWLAKKPLDVGGSGWPILRCERQPPTTRE